MNDKSYMSVNTFQMEHIPPYTPIRMSWIRSRDPKIPPPSFVDGAGAGTGTPRTTPTPLDRDKLTPMSSGLMDLFYEL